MTSTLFHGNVAHSTTIDKITWLEDALVVVDAHGKIAHVETGGDIETVRQQYGISAENVIELKKTQFIVPGFIDTHIHASQYVNAGLALDLPLLDWLNKYTFPTEARYQNVDFARDVYTRVVANTLANGTTTAMYFATIHKESSLVLADLAHKFGQRAFVGKLSMDQNSPDYYTEASDAALSEMEDFIQQLLNKKYAHVQPVITPRFAISCTMPLMTRLAELSRKYNLNIQTHISENPAECKFVVSLFDGCCDYVDIYEKANLLTEKTILAHGVYLSDRELDVLNKYKTSISHCPNSNCSIRSGLCDARRLIDHGIQVGLGTDVSGGYHPSILDAMRFAMTVSNILSLSKPAETYQPLTYNEAFYLATHGGAAALGIADKVGTIQVGKYFDALVIDLAQADGNLDLWPNESHTDLISKWIHLGDDRSISQVYVAGIEVKQAAKKVLTEKRMA